MSNKFCTCWERDPDLQSTMYYDDEGRLIHGNCGLPIKKPASIEPRIGDTIHTWSKNKDGTNLHKVIDVRPYTGRFKDWFTWVVRFEADVNRGWMEISCNAGSYKRMFVEGVCEETGRGWDEVWENPREFSL